MKKKFLSGIAVIAIAAFTAFNVNFINEDNLLSDLLLNNIEALAGGESGETINCGNTCTGAYCGKFTYKDGSTHTVYFC